jgi:methylmalonyl-CoA/ethylmalonyl-CoA epimerase
MRKIEHIGIAVEDLEKSNALFSSLFNVEGPYKEEEVESEFVKTAFFRSGNNKIELVQGLNADNAISKFIAKRGEGIHHIAFDVPDIIKEMTRLKAEGFILLNEEPKIGADNKLVCFVHPKSSNGVLIELCQEIPA